MNPTKVTATNASSYRSMKTEIRTSPTQGRGLFAKEAIDKGEIISVRGGHILTREMEEILTKPVGYWAYPIADELVLAPLRTAEVETVMMFLNHSCEPNVGILGQILFVAMREIMPDEELTIDYAMFGADKEPMPCNCRSSHCRGLITNADWRLEQLQTKYRGYFSSYIQLKINAM
ncbi:SET domain-containing protein-lysine N-methyltransferase [Rhodocytophaga aerolata]|uniref:SET domain-containing protein-lysine N-methyltransferase n=1 Tax=Rhodocytophaga aerolata TaxID=455078 RepID=A0ABT8RF82_9BACT|nr:SET domain-containing protein-lysine N-methyltransferase [Rhodocytophaga aerolata]MDO1450771.1 SET domain-containing protein-lysine N-methyltransferase [Rhodocytophaga aerolata]